MNKRWRYLPGLLILLVSVRPLHGAEEITAGEEKTLREEIAELNDHLVQMIDLMQTLLDNQKIAFERQEIDVIMKRLELGNHKMTSMERQLNAEKMKRSKTEEEMAFLRAEMAKFEDQSASDDMSAGGMTEEELKDVRERLALQQNILKERLWKTDQRILELEDKIISWREKMAGLENSADDLLDLR
jgi:hypothetical protein